MRYLACILLGSFIGIALTVFSYRVERADDFYPVYFDSGNELPAECVPTDKPLIFFRRTDKQVFVCEHDVWEETD